MASSTFFGLIALLYYAVSLLLTGLVGFVLLKGRGKGTRFSLRSSFFWLSVSLLVWQLTLFLETRTSLPSLQLSLGRLNFTAIVFAVFFALRFVQSVPRKKGEVGKSTLSLWLFAETLLLALLTLLTTLVSSSERVEEGQAITTYGTLFPLYLFHVVGYLLASLLIAFRERSKAEGKQERKQLTLIGCGMLLTGGIALVTNAWLPYAYGDFRFCDLGALSTLLFVLAIAYATFLHRLFGVKTLLRETLVYGILLAFVLGGYSSTVFLATQYLTGSTDKVTQFAVLFLAFSFDPLRRFLEKKTDQLLFGEREEKGEENETRKWLGKQRDEHGKQQERRGGGLFSLALLFPWRRP